jgi:hypothetical protein
MLILPLVFGAVMVSLFEIEKGVINSYIIGFISLMALCELIAVPCVFFKLSFNIVMVMFFLAIGVFLIIGVLKNQLLSAMCLKRVKTNWASLGTTEHIAIVVMILSWSIVIYNSVRLYVVDQDDSRFIVTAADIISTNTLFLTDPNTGIIHSSWAYGMDAAKDIIAPHAVFAAILSRITMTSVTVFMHSIYPIFLYILAMLIYYNLISELIEGNSSLKNLKHKVAYKCLFVSIIFLFTVFHYSTRNTREAVFMVRLWQGKAILAGVAIPALFWVFYKLYRECNKPSLYLLFVVTIASCLVSSMATLLLPFMIGVYGLVYGISKKSIKVLLSIWSSATIPLILAILSLYIRNELLLC